MSPDGKLDFSFSLSIAGAPVFYYLPGKACCHFFFIGTNGWDRGFALTDVSLSKETRPETFI
jgi:hypothetical protein